MEPASLHAYHLEETEFDTEQEAKDYATSHATEHGAVLKIRRSCKKKKQAYLCCSRGSYAGGTSRKFKQLETGQQGKGPKRNTEQTLCPYIVYVRFVQQRHAWVLTGSKKPHNHELPLPTHQKLDIEHQQTGTEIPDQLDQFIPRIRKLDVVKQATLMAKILDLIEEEEKGEKQEDGGTRHITGNETDKPSSLASVEQGAIVPITLTEETDNLSPASTESFTLAAEYMGDVEIDMVDPKAVLPASKPRQQVPTAPGPATSAENYMDTETSDEEISYRESKVPGKPKFTVKRSAVTAVRPDGNCGFRAISQGLFSTPERWREVRANMLEYVKTGYEPYIAKIRREKDTNYTIDKLRQTLRITNVGNAPPDTYLSDLLHLQIAADRWETPMVAVTPTDTRIDIYTPYQWGSGNTVWALRNRLKNPTTDVVCLLYDGKVHWDYVDPSNGGLRQRIAGQGSFASLETHKRRRG